MGCHGRQCLAASPLLLLLEYRINVCPLKLMHLILGFSSGTVKHLTLVTNITILCCEPSFANIRNTLEIGRFKVAWTFTFDRTLRFVGSGKLRPFYSGSNANPRSEGRPY
jgi:hypothetical protein